ncbi:MAG: ABC transporter permease [Opitutaceae bacterium]|nr:ABC transporter permease [Opitutaceae bacterium]
MLSDLRFALRSLAKSPGFTAVVVLSLALGIGATTTVFCWIENLLLRPYPGVARQQDLVILTTSYGSRMWDTLSLPDLRDAAELKDIFAGIAGSQQTPAHLTVDRHPEWVYGQIVTANFFAVLGVKPILGRAFLPEEDEKPGGHPVLVISEHCWRRNFASDPAVIGRVVDLNRHAFTIVGVAPADFSRGDTTGLSVDFWAPVMMHREVAFSGADASQILQRYARWYHTLARLQPGVTVGQARAALDTLSARLARTCPDTNRDIRLHARPPWNSTYGAAAIFRPVLRLLLAVSLGVLLIVSANVANLLLARATSRRREIAVRLAVGASRPRLVRQLLTESLVLALLGGALGVLLAYWTVDLFPLFLPRTYLPIDLGQAVDLRTLAAALGLTLVTSLLFGLVPALQSTNPHLEEALKEGGRTSDAGPQHRARSLLVVTEVALALVLLVGAGLCLKGLRRSREVDTGLDSRGVLLAGLRIGMNGYTRDTAPAFYRALRERIAALPGVESAALANWFPLGFEDTGSDTIDVPGYPRRPGEQLSYRRAIVSPGYFATLRIPLVAGRDFTDADDAQAPRVAIINEIMAQRFWPGQDAVGRTFTYGGKTTIIGVVRTGKYRALNDAPECFFYLPASQAAWQLDLDLCVRAAQGEAADPSALAGRLREEIHRLDPAVEIWQTLPFAAYIAAASLPQKIAASLLTFLSLVALVLAAMGVYAVMAYAVSQRTQEFGVRMALGATPGEILLLVLKRGLALAAIGMGCGLVLAVLGTRLLAGFLYGISPFDRLTFMGVPLLLGLVTVLACWLPARRATKVNPIEALRAE